MANPMEKFFAETGPSFIEGNVVKGRIIDLSKGAASALGFSGLHKVHLAVLGSSKE